MDGEIPGQIDNTWYPKWDAVAATSYNQVYGEPDLS